MIFNIRIHTNENPQVVAMWAHAAWARVAIIYEYRLEVDLAVVPIIRYKLFPLQHDFKR